MTFRNKKVLVAGGAGFVGTNLIQRLLSLGAQVRATFHEKPPQLANDRIEYISADLRRATDCARAVAGMEYVFMCAAQSSGAGMIEKRPLIHVTPNVIINTLMLEAAHAAGVKKYLWLSSNTVYPAFDHAVREEEMLKGPPFKKYIPVATMKRFGEALCEIYANHIPNPLTTIVIRPANIYGPYDDFAWETSHVVPALIRKVVERKSPLEVWGDGTEIKDLIFIDDFLDGMLIAMEKMAGPDPINIGTGVPVSIRDVLQAIITADNYQNAPIKYNTTKPTMIAKRLLDVTKAEQMLGFKTKTTLQEGIRKTISWYREHRL